MFLIMFSLAGQPSEAAAAAGNPATLHPSEADRRRAEELVNMLASPIFRHRANAIQQLRQMGRRALTVIAPASESHPDPEVRFRCELLRPAAEAEEFTARLQLFLADTAGQYEHRLPGWQTFQKLVGTGQHERVFYVTLLKSENNRSLLAELSSAPEELRAKLLNRLSDLHAKMFPQFLAPGEKRYSPSLDDAVTVLLAEATLAENLPPTTRLSSLNLIYQNNFRQALASPETKPILEAILKHWLNTRPGTNGLVLAMNVAHNLKIPAASDYAARVLENDTIPATTRALAAMQLAASGDKKYLNLLESLFNDTSVIRQGTEDYPIELRDAALAASILLAGKDPIDFGFISKKIRGASQKYYYWNYSFRDDQSRHAAFSRWRSHEAGASQ